MKPGLIPQLAGLAIVLSPGCGRGLYGSALPAAAGPGKDAAGERDAAADFDDGASADRGAGPDEAVANGDSSRRPDGLSVALPAGTTWSACGRLGRDWPNALAHSPDGKRLALGLGSGFFAVAELGASTFTVPGDNTVPGVPTRIAFSADG